MKLSKNDSQHLIYLAIISIGWGYVYDDLRTNPAKALIYRNHKNKNVRNISEMIIKGESLNTHWSAKHAF